MNTLPQDLRERVQKDTGRVHFLTEGYILGVEGVFVEWARDLTKARLCPTCQNIGFLSHEECGEDPNDLTVDTSCPDCVYGERERLHRALCRVMEVLESSEENLAERLFDISGIVARVLPIEVANCAA